MNKVPANFKTYLQIKNELISWLKTSELNYQTYSPYSKYPHLETILIYNNAFVDSNQAVVHISGTHGVEGYAGALAQTEILQSHLAKLKKSPIGFLMIFALNPFGFHFLRRTNIDNIDLNRNVTSIYPHPFQNKIQNKAVKLLLSSKNKLQLAAGLTSAIASMPLIGKNKIVQAFAEGQDHSPQGLFYSGKAVAVEIQTLFSKLEPFLKNKKKLHIIEFHTGLGRPYDEMLISCSHETTEMSKIFGTQLILPHSDPEAYENFGLFSEQFTARYPSCKIEHVIQELGSLHTMASFLNLALENEFHFAHFNKISEAEYLKHSAKSLILKTFYNHDPKWQAWVRLIGLKRFDQVWQSYQSHI